MLLVNPHSRSSRHCAARVNATNMLQGISDAEPHPQRGPLEDMDQYQQQRLFVIMLIQLTPLKPWIEIR